MYMTSSPVPSHQEIDNRPVRCQVCGREKTIAETMPAEMVRDSIVQIIRKDLPGWTPDGYICRDDLDAYRARLVSEVLKSGVAEADSIEAMVAKSIAEQDMLSRNVNEEFDTRTSFGQRLADRMASFGGSWTFIILFAIALVAWIMVNTDSPFEPPFNGRRGGNGYLAGKLMLFDGWKE
jgi:hypothetical protein